MKKLKKKGALIEDRSITLRNIDEMEVNLNVESFISNDGSSRRSMPIVTKSTTLKTSVDYLRLDNESQQRRESLQAARSRISTT